MRRTFELTRTLSLALLLVAALATESGAVFTSRFFDYGHQTPEEITFSRTSEPISAEAEGRLAAFQDRYGLETVDVSWDRFRGTPYRLRAPGLNAGTAITSEKDVEAAVASLLATDAELFGLAGASIKADLIREYDGRWIATYLQYHEGLRVIHGRFDVRLRKNGAIGLISSQVFPDVELDTAMALSIDEARKFAQDNIPEPTNDFTVFHLEPVVMPFLNGKAYEYSVGYLMALKHNETMKEWAVIIDGNTGDLLFRRAITMHLNGNVKGRINFQSGLSPALTANLADVEVNINGANSEVTDIDGNWDSPSTNNDATVSAQLKGPWIETRNEDGFDAQAQAQAINGTADILFDNSNSTASERNVFFFGNLSHQWVKRVDSSFLGMDYGVVAKVNQRPSDPSLQCNAWWSQSDRTMNFTIQYPGCGGPTGLFGDVTIHEFGHGFTYAVYGNIGWTSPTRDMHEAHSDILANTILDKADIGTDFSGPGSIIRSSINNQTWPGSNCGSDFYCVSQALSGAMWDLREALKAKHGDTLGVEIFDRIFHNARLARPNDQETFLDELFDADDNDGDISNGSPNFDEICNAFDPRGFDCPIVVTGVSIAHAPLATTDETTQPYEIEAVVVSNASAVTPNGTTLHYSINGGAFQTVAMAPRIATGDVYLASIPAQPVGTSVRYYISSSDLTGNRATSPENAPPNVHEFDVANIIYANTFDGPTDEGWVHDLVLDQDDWHRDPPTGTSVYDPDAAYSAPNVWGNDVGGARNGQPWNGDYRSNVENFLTSPSIDCSGHRDVRLSFRRWLTVEAGQYDQATIEVNGQEVWANPVADNLIDDSWVFQEVDISSIADGQSDVQVTFRLKSDGGVEFGGWNIDDFLLTGGDANVTPAPTATPTGIPTPTPTPTAPANLDILPPYLTDTQPRDGDAGVLETTSIRFVIRDDRPTDSGIDENSIQLFIDGVPLFVVTDPLSTPEAVRVTYQPSFPLPLGSSVTVRVEAQDFAGNDMVEEYSFEIRSDQRLGTPTPTLVPTATVPPLATETPEPSLTPTPTAEITPFAPEMVAEPEYTEGTSNEVTWLRKDLRAVEFYVEMSDAPDFPVIIANSGWISDTKHRFTGLQDQVQYSYRVKSRLSTGAESEWSNVVSSIQDSEAPGILLAGYLTTDLEAQQGGRITLNAYATAPDAELAMPVLFQGVDTGLRLNDNGLDFDALANDGLYTFTLDLSPSQASGQILLEIELMDEAGNISTWPYLTVGGRSSNPSAGQP